MRPEILPVRISDYFHISAFFETVSYPKWLLFLPSLYHDNTDRFGNPCEAVALVGASHRCDFFVIPFVFVGYFLGQDFILLRPCHLFNRGTLTILILHD